MLQNIHDITKGWIAWVILSIIALTFALMGIQSYLGNEDGMDTVAVVNGTKITKNQLNTVYERLFASAKAADAQKLKQQALEQLISSHVLSQAALAKNYRFSETQVATIIRTMPTFQANGQFSPTRFQDVIRSLLYSETSFMADLRAANLVNQPRAGFISSNFALPPETNQALELINQTRDIRYTIIPAARFLAEQKITDQAILTYYKNNQQHFNTPEKIRIEYLKLSPKDLSDKEFADRSETLAELTYTHPDSLAPAAKALGLSVQKTEWFSRDSKTPSKKIIAAAFSPDVLEQKNNSPVI
ncbi:MAG: SurA N-terminal domain-containing protein, partial [Gammaproteobacteria bacterium]